MGRVGQRVDRRLPCAFAAGVLLLLWGLGFGGCRSAPRPPPPGYGRRIMIEATGYCPCGKCCGWVRNWYGRVVYAYGPNKGKRKRVGTCADGTKARLGTVAADTRYYPFGTRMHVPDTATRRCTTGAETYGGPTGSTCTSRRTAKPCSGAVGAYPSRSCPGVELGPGTVAGARRESVSRPSPPRTAALRGGDHNTGTHTLSQLRLWADTANVSYGP